MNDVIKYDHKLEQYQDTVCDVNGNLWQYSKDVCEH